MNDIRCAYCQKKIAEVMNDETLLVCSSTDFILERNCTKMIIFSICKKCKKKTIIYQKN